MLFGTLDPISPISGNIVGMRVSHYEFLKALIQYSNFTEYHFFAGDAFTVKQCNDFTDNLLNITENAKKVTILRREQLPRYVRSRDYTVFHKHDPHIEHLCYLRDAFSSHPFPITGIVHSLSYQRFQYDFFRTITANTYPFDSILCTSRASKKVISSQFASLSENLKKRVSVFLKYNGIFYDMPFGVDIDRFSPAASGDKQLIRKEIGLPENGLLILTLSRFSQHSKMDLYPVIRRLKPLFMKYNSLFYVLAGSGHESDYPEKLKEFASSLGIGSHIIILKDIDESIKADLYRASDIFLSPSDNFQESFGLNMLEAMSSGLPVIASNWNGYKDIVEDGKTGYLIDTLWGECDSEITGLAPMAFEREYHLFLAQSVAVDVNHLAARLEKLILEESLRIKMGNNARQRAEQKYSWQNIIQRYEDLVTRLKKISDTHDFKKNKKDDYPFLLNYFDVFNHYPSKILSDSNIITLSEYGRDVIQKKAKITIYDSMDNILDMESVLLILQNVSHNDMSVSELKVVLQNRYPVHRIVYAILWMIKYDFLKIKQ